jgi:hypothetical protein
MVLQVSLVSDQSAGDVRVMEMRFKGVGTPVGDNASGGLREGRRRPLAWRAWACWGLLGGSFQLAAREPYSGDGTKGIER